MKLLQLCAATLVSVLGSAQLACAETPSLSQMTLGYTYFNRPEASVQMHDEAVIGCALEGAKTRSVDDMTAPPGGLLMNTIMDAVGAAYNRSTAASGLENCMVVRGWRVVRVPESEGVALAALDQAALATRLSEWIGAVQPHGEIVRVWNNEALDAANNHVAIRPGKTKDGQLSLKAAKQDAPKDAPPAEAAPVKVVLDPKWTNKRLAPEDLARIPEGGGVMILFIRNPSMRNGIGFTFNRVGPAPGVKPSISDHGPDIMGQGVGMFSVKKEGNIVAVAVPAGRWRILGIGGVPGLNLCLGAPAFDIAPGEIVFTGSLDMAASDLTPNMDLAPARAWAGAQPAAEKLKAATWMNGSTDVCSGAAIYALEFKGAGFVPGYTAGSLAMVR